MTFSGQTHRFRLYARTYIRPSKRAPHVLEKNVNDTWNTQGVKK